MIAQARAISTATTAVSGTTQEALWRRHRAKDRQRTMSTTAQTGKAEFANMAIKDWYATQPVRPVVFFVIVAVIAFGGVCNRLRVASSRLDSRDQARLDERRRAH